MRYIVSNDQTSIAYREPVKAHSLLHTFNAWCTAQDAQHHFGWTGISLLATAAVFFPLTMAFVLVNGAAFPLIITAMVALVLVLVLNLAAMPTRYTIPAFFFGIGIDIAIIATSIFM